VSLRARLLLAVGVVVLVALTILSGATYSALRNTLYAQVDATLASAELPLVNAVLYDGGISPEEVARFAPGMFVEVRGPRGQPFLGEEIASETPGGQTYTPRLPARLPVNLDVPDREVVFNAPASQPGGPLFRVQVTTLGGGAALILAAPLTQATTTLRFLLAFELIVGAAALVAALALAWGLVGIGLKPLQDMERTTAAIAAGEWDRRVPEGERTTELGRLARSFNVMLDRIQDAFARRDATEAQLRRSEEQLRRFVADASHELRTPVAAVAAYAELFERGARQRPEDLARVLTGIRTETARMAQLVEDLLLLARLDEGRPLAREPVELVGLVAEALEAARAVGPSWPVELVARRAVEVVGDRGRLRQVVDNLLANVRGHTPEGTRTRVRVAEEGGLAVVEVADNGPGLPPDTLSRVFERFYRADPSRTRSRGGAGLGLAIVAAIVAAHGGRVEARNNPEGGATFTIRLPLASPDTQRG
jgi:two-component system OmpR family sensor kinase